MPLYLEGVIKLIQVNNVKGKDRTEDFTYYTNFIQYEDKEGLQKVLELNSKDDYREFLDQEGMVTIKATKTKAKLENGLNLKDATLYKLTLGGFAPAK